MALAEETRLQLDRGPSTEVTAMFPRLLLVSILLLLGACQSPRIERDFDTSRDFAAYRSWSWQEPALAMSPCRSRKRPIAWPMN